jgi:hypothetical protein
MVGWLVGVCLVCSSSGVSVLYIELFKIAHKFFFGSSLNLLHNDELCVVWY